MTIDESQEVLCTIAVVQYLGFFLSSGGRSENSTTVAELQRATADLRWVVMQGIS